MIIGVTDSLKLFLAKNFTRGSHIDPHNLKNYIIQISKFLKNSLFCLLFFWGGAKTPKHTWWTSPTWESVVLWFFCTKIKNEIIGKSHDIDKFHFNGGWVGQKKHLIDFNILCWSSVSNYIVVLVFIIDNVHLGTTC